MRRSRFRVFQLCTLLINIFIYTQAFNLPPLITKPNNHQLHLYLDEGDNNAQSAIIDHNNQVAVESSGSSKFNINHYATSLPEQETTILSEEATRANLLLSSSSSSNENNYSSDKRLFALELLKMLHEQYGTASKLSSLNSSSFINKKEDRISILANQNLNRGPIMTELLNALNANGDISRLTDWIRNSFNLASIGELTTQFVVSKLGSVNCAAILKPDPEETLVPRFLLFNEHFVDVPFELKLQPTSTECLAHGKFDPLRKTIILMHGYLTGYTLVDGLTNIKNRILDLNRIINENSLKTFREAAQNNGSFLLTEDLEIKIRLQQYNVIFVDWFNGANPIVRSRYIRAAVNSQVVGQLIARFLASIVQQCKTPAINLQIIAHSLGCHVAGFTGKQMNALGLRLGKITHLDPVGLCFGRLFSEQKYRLAPNDALETQAVHVSLNLFDNPLDGAQANFLVNGGRDQVGCGGQSELKNSTASSISLLFDSDAKFNPCSHIRALSLYEDDLSSKPNQCQIVGYKCSTYDKFLAGKCGACDEQNSQCRLMSFPPLSEQFHRMSLKPFAAAPGQVGLGKQQATTAGFQQAAVYFDDTNNVSVYKQLRQNGDNQTWHSSTSVSSSNDPPTTTTTAAPPLVNLIKNFPNGSIAWVIDDRDLNQQISSTIAKFRPELIEVAQAAGGGGAKGYDDAGKKSIEEAAYDDEDRESLAGYLMKNKLDSINHQNEIKRSDRRLSLEQRERLVMTIEKLRSDAKQKLNEGWSSFAQEIPKFKVSSVINPAKLISSSSSLAAQQHLMMLNQDGKLPLPLPLQVAVTTNLLQHQPLSIPNQPTLESTKTSAPVAAAAAAAATDIPTPLGGQALPSGSINQPIYFVGTSSLSPYCVNYYQFKLIIAESRIHRLLNANVGSAQPNRLSPSSLTIQHNSNQIGGNPHQRQASLNREMLHLTVKLLDSQGHFFKGFTILEDARMLNRIPIDKQTQKLVSGIGGNLVELTMLLNTTQLEPIRISETIISYYFHPIVLADSIQINYMSNISPEIRAKYSSNLCPIAINDKHQLVRYVDCSKTSR